MSLSIVFPVTAFLMFMISGIAGAKIIVCCHESNDVWVALQTSAVIAARFERVDGAISSAGVGDGMLILADEYPEKTVKLDQAFFDEAAEKKLSLYLEYPSFLPALELGEVRSTTWERVVDADSLGILSGHEMRFVPLRAEKPRLMIARVAGYDRAVYGLPKEHWPLLFEMNGGRWLVATSKLSNFITARYAPVQQWKRLWVEIVSFANGAPVQLAFQATVMPTFGPEALPADVEKVTLRRAARWYLNSRLLVHSSRMQEIYKQVASGQEIMAAPAEEPVSGDGSLGILEGYASKILSDGMQPWRAVIRADCQAESAMALAMGAEDASSRSVARNLLDYLFFSSNMQGGKRGDPKHPAYGLIAWGALSPAWEVANYGDDNARTILAAVAAASVLETDRYDASLLRALFANLRTTGKLGFRGDRIDMPQLEARGWRHFHDAATVNYAPHFETYLWACYLWAYARTGTPEFLDKARSGLAMTMEAYPSKWRWQDNMERSKMLLPLAWLVRVEDTAEHRAWLERMAADLLEYQDACGAIRDHLATRGSGHFQVPQSNEEYGTKETPMIQSNDDPACDQLYTTPFALLGLHEAAAVLGDGKLRQEEEGLAKFLCRIQIRSKEHAWLDGAWFRAFDFRKWDYWASSADVGWGAWCVEAGWGQAWIAATLALRERGTTLWEMTGKSNIAWHLKPVRAEMAY
jgi:hypothetical protein